MTRQRMFLDVDVVEAARMRMRHIYDTFDTVCVLFSGGKDSSAVLWLAKEIHEERGLGPVKVIFRDEEIVSPSVVRFIEEVRDYDWVDMEIYALPQGQELWVLGKREYVLAWSGWRGRNDLWVRPMIEGSITAQHFGLDPDQSLPQPIDYYTLQGKSGMTAFIQGVRANESMVRYRSLVQKLHENYIVHPFRLPKSLPLRFAKPIYDWVTNDVLKYLDDVGGKYAEYYDLAAMSGSNTRVGTPLHSVAVRRIGDVVATEPEFYDRLVEIWPHLDAQRRLWADLDTEALIHHYAKDGWDGVKRCIDENMLTPGKRRRALAFAADFRRKAALDPFGYPLDHLVRTLLLQEFTITSANPVGPKTRAHTMRVAALEQEESADAAPLQ